MIYAPPEQSHQEIYPSSFFFFFLFGVKLKIRIFVYKKKRLRQKEKTKKIFLKQISNTILTAIHIAKVDGRIKLKTKKRKAK